jgi:hypothetical protein
VPVNTNRCDPVFVPCSSVQKAQPYNRPGLRNMSPAIVAQPWDTSFSKRNPEGVALVGRPLHRVPSLGLPAQPTAREPPEPQTQGRPNGKDGRARPSSPSTRIWSPKSRMQSHCSPPDLAIPFGGGVLAFIAARVDNALSAWSDKPICPRAGISDSPLAGTHVSRPCRVYPARRINQ